LNRLYEDYNLRHIGLEGAMATDGILDATWLQLQPLFRAHNTIRGREDVIVQLLEDGEISSAEMMALVYDDATVIGIEDASEYDVTLPEGASSAPTVYLYLIAVPGMTNSEITKANDLINQDEILEAIEFIINTDPFTDEMYKRINDESVIISAEEWLEMLDEIEAKASAVGAEIESETRTDMQALRKFFETASRRSDTMVAYVLDLVETYPDAPVAMIIGAAHTEKVVESFTDAQVSVAVLRANSLDKQRKEGNLSSEAYDRKLLGRSVDPPGSLGSLLDGRKKPPSVIQKLWFQVKARIFLTVTHAARAIAEGHSMDELEGMLPTFDNVTFHPLRMDGNELVFAIDTVDNNGNLTKLYGRAVVNKLAVEKLLEERLFEGLDNVRSKEPPDPSVLEPSTVATPTVTRLSSDTIAMFSNDQNAVETSRLGS
jgi:hypothetical protein